jgi:hypothetical protein
VVEKGLLLSKGMQEDTGVMIENINSSYSPMNELCRNDYTFFK